MRPLALGMLALAGTFALATVVAGADWNQWRGPKRDGVSDETGWKPWGADGPKTLWEAALGGGYSTVAVANGRVYSMGNAGDRDTVWCLDAEKGTVVWKYGYACGSDRQYPGPRATPTVDGDVVYTMSRKAQVFALGAKDGKVLWSRELGKDPGAKTPKWDFAGSPLVEGGLLILNAGEKGIALDKRTGQVVWKSGSAPAGYASPVLFEANGKRAVLLFCAKGLCARDAKTGQELWWHAWPTQHDVNSADPIVSSNRVFISSGYNHGGALLEIVAGGPKVLWESKQMRCHTNACVLVDGHLYGSDGTVNQGDMKCVELATGEVKWSKPKFAGAATAAGDRVIYMSASGVLAISKASPAGYEELARAQVLDGECWTVPVLANGRLYCRNTKGRLICLDVK